MSITSPTLLTSSTWMLQGLICYQSVRMRLRWSAYILKWLTKLFGTVQSLSHEPVVRYVILRVAHAQGMPVTFSLPPTTQKPLVIDYGMRHARAVMHAGITSPRWRGKKFPAFQRMRSPQFDVSDKRPIAAAGYSRWGNQPRQAKGKGNAVCSRLRIQPDDVIIFLI